MTLTIDGKNNFSMNSIRFSPIHAWLTAHTREWGSAGDAQLALRLDTADADQTAVSDLALCDVSVLAKLGLKGARAAEWLSSAGVTVPTEVFATGPLVGDGLVVRLGSEEFFLEEGLNQSFVVELGRRLGPGQPGIYRIERHDGTFLLCGQRATKVLAQTCGINFQETPFSRALFTRVAGINCTILPQMIGGVAIYRLWTDPSFAVDLWHTLDEITSELQGKIVGVASVYHHV
jgi:sarcosine oxidase subunit gamma